MTRRVKPLGRKSYGSIGHLPGSRLGSGDHMLPDGQALIATQKARDKHDVVIVTEKLDGSCMAVAKIDGVIWPLGRAGYPAWSSPYEFQRRFAAWVVERQDMFNNLLDEGERLVGEWLLLAHGTIYEGLPDYWLVFDLMREDRRAPFEELLDRIDGYSLTHVPLVSLGNPCSIDEAMSILSDNGHYKARDGVEGAVWRVERKGKPDFLAKYVRHDKVDGRYLPGVAGNSENADPIWMKLERRRSAR